MSPLLAWSPSLTSSVIQLSSDTKTELLLDNTSTCSKPLEPTTSSIFKAFIKRHVHPKKPQQALARSLLTYSPIDMYQNDKTVAATSTDSDDDYMYAYSGDEEFDSGTNYDSMVHEDLVKKETVIVKQPDPQLLPFPAVSVRWYVHQNKLAKHNAARDSIHQSMAVETDKDGNISHINRSVVVSTLEEYVIELRK